jgi:hypothetical protein
MTKHNNQSGQVKLQNRKSSLTSSVFWSMKITSTPPPASDAIAPPVSRLFFVASTGLGSPMSSPGMVKCSLEHSVL